MLLRKGVYLYEYIDSWERFDGTSLPDKKAFYIDRNIKAIKNVDYIHAKIVFKYFNKKKITWLSWFSISNWHFITSDLFKNFRNKCIEIYELDHAHFSLVPGLTWKAALKMTGVKLELLTNNNKLTIAEKGIRCGICHAIHTYAKANNKNMKKYDKNKKSSNLMYLDANNLYGWAISKKLAVDVLNLNEITLNLVKTLQKTMMKIVIKDIFLR